MAKFCSDMIAASAVAGPSGVTGTVSGSSTKTAIPQLIRSYDNGDGSGKVMVRIDSDVTNYSQAQTNVTCPDNWLYDIHLAGYSSCYQYLGTTIDNCDKNSTGSSSDINWKHGGTIFTHCFYFTVLKFPPGGPGDTSV